METRAGTGAAGATAGVPGAGPEVPGRAGRRHIAVLRVFPGLHRLAATLDRIEGARGHLLLWAPVFLGAGIGLWFALRLEPGPRLYGAAAVAAALSAGPWLAGLPRVRLPAAAAFLLALGFLAAGARAHLVAAPVLSFRYYGPVEGRVVMIDRSFSDQIRLTLDRVTLTDVAPWKLPAQVRVALHGDQGGFRAEPGLTVRLLAHLAPPEGPVAPGGFDFQRLAWFSRLGAVGYTRKPVEVVAPPEAGAGGLAGHRARMRISAAMQREIPGQPGAFAAALLTGDRSGISAATNAAMRASNLSHLISISGLHMGLLTGFVFGALRTGIALVPPLALRIPAKKIAAFAALWAATGYLWLAGPNVATERAYVMAAVMLVAVLADRRAISLRSVAIAALILLMLEPESLVEPGFQMSFGATVALIVCFQPWARIAPRLPAPLRPVAMLVLSSFVAGMATAPIAAAHFNRVPEYGLVANLLAVPVMGILVMPFGVIAGLLAPLGLAALPLWVMGLGCRWILAVAEGVAGLDGAVWAVPAPPPGALPLLALGGIAAALLPGVWRLAGAGLAVLAFALWSGAARPALLVAGDGALLGLMGPEGRALSKPKGAGFVASAWLEDDGDTATQDRAAARPGFAVAKGEVRAELGGRVIVQLTGKSGPDRVAAACRDGALVILAGTARAEDRALTAGTGAGGTATERTATEGTATGRACDLWDQPRLRRTGALAIDAAEGGGLRITTAREVSGPRLWTNPPRRK